MITASEVHLMLQEMNKSLPACDDMITITAIANILMVTPNELALQMETLASLYYVKYTDRRKTNIRLTFNGINTLVPPPQSVIKLQDITSLCTSGAKLQRLILPPSI